MSAHPPPLPSDPLLPELEEFCARYRLPERYRALDREPAFPRREFRAMGEARWLGLHVGEALGGRALPLGRVAVVLFHLAHRAGTTFAKLSLQPEFASILYEHGSAELIERYYRPLMRGELLIGNQITEPGAGSDARSLECSARRDGDSYLLTGTKSEAAFAADADAAIVYARVEGSAAPTAITALLVPQGLPGIEREVVPDLGERWMRRGQVTYRQVRVPLANRIGEEGEGFRYVRAELTRERALLAAIYLGVARASWEETLAHADRRVTFRRRLAEHQAVAFPLVEDGARIEASWLFTERALSRIGRGEPAEADAALAKWMSTEVALRAIDHAIQFHGGSGYSALLPHEQRWRDVRSGPIAHGPSEILHLVAARELWDAPGRGSRDPPSAPGAADRAPK